MKPHCSNRFGTCPVCNYAESLAQARLNREGRKRQVDALIGDIVEYIARGFYDAANATMDTLFRYVEAD